ncbi:unnamed protein product [Ectocarpus sp. 12 AP-2014]
MLKVKLCRRRTTSSMSMCCQGLQDNGVMGHLREASKRQCWIQSLAVWVGRQSKRKHGAIWTISLHRTAGCGCLSIVTSFQQKYSHADVRLQAGGGSTSCLQKIQRQREKVLARLRLQKKSLHVGRTSASARVDGTACVPACGGYSCIRANGGFSPILDTRPSHPHVLRAPCMALLQEAAETTSRGTTERRGAGEPLVECDQRRFCHQRGIA